MINEKGVLKLVDFGVAREDMSYTDQYTNFNVGINSYKAPELFCAVSDNQKDSLCNYRVDLWALGVFLQYLFTFELPFGRNGEELENKVINV